MLSNRQKASLFVISSTAVDNGKSLLIQATFIAASTVFKWQNTMAFIVNQPQEMKSICQ